MAETAGPSTSTKQPDPPMPLMSLDAEERRKLLLKSLRPRSFPLRQVRSDVAVNESRYISQFTSGRWRECIHHSSKDGKSANDDKSEPPHQLVIYGYDLQGDDYRSETDMIKQWNLVERDLYFPNLEKGYVEKRNAKNQIKSEADDLDAPQTIPCQDVATEERQNLSEIAEKALETSPGGSKDVPSTSQASLNEPSQDVVMEECQESPQTAPQASQESPEVVEESAGIVLEGSQESPVTVPESSNILPETAPQASQESPEVVEESAGIVLEGSRESPVTVPESSCESSVIASEVCRKSPSKSADAVPSESETSEGQKTSGDLKEETVKELVSEDSKSDARDSSESGTASGPSISAEDSKGPSKSEMEASEATLRGKRKADAAASSEKENPEEKKTRKIIGKK